MPTRAKFRFRLPMMPSRAGRHEAPACCRNVIGAVYRLHPSRSLRSSRRSAAPHVPSQDVKTFHAHKDRPNRHDLLTELMPLPRRTSAPRVAATLHSFHERATRSQTVAANPISVPAALLALDLHIPVGDDLAGHVGASEKASRRSLARCLRVSGDREEAAE